MSRIPRSLRPSGGYPDLATDPVGLRPFGWLPAVSLSAALVLTVLVWSPPVGDLAAQTFRAELFQRSGFAIWNASWYAGHYTLTYSVLFPPLAALLGPQEAGALAVVTASYLFDRLIRQRWGDRSGWATLWFGFGMALLLLAGQLTFALGVALGLLALRFLQREHPLLAGLAAVACALGSPVAAVFLAGVLVAGAAAGPRQRAVAPLCVGLAGLGTVVLLNLAFPENSQFPFALTSFIGVPVWCAGALYLTRKMPEEREFRTVVVAYGLVSLMVLVLPNPLGGNAIRLGGLFGGPVLAAILLARRPKVPIALVALLLGGCLYWQAMPGVRAVAQSSGDPSTTRAYYAPVRAWLNDHGGQQVRIEVPPTLNHWEAAYLAPSFDLARGWLRQLDTTRDELFYDSHVGARGYAKWLRANAVHYVVLPDAKLDYSARGEAALIRRGPSYLVPRWSSSHWRVFAVSSPGTLVKPLGSAAGVLAKLHADSLVVRATSPGAFLVRFHYTPFWKVSSAAACIDQSGNWTRLNVSRPGRYRISTDFSVGDLLPGGGGGGGC